MSRIKKHRKKNVFAKATPVPVAKAPDNVIDINSARERQKKPRKPRMLMIAHNHPHFFPGGAEILAYDLFKAIREHTHYEPFFMAGVAHGERHFHEGTPFQAITSASDEILFLGSNFDYFYQSQQIFSFIYQDFKLFLQKFQPDIIHFHHTMRIGLEALPVARQVLPDIKIVYTLHEFILMCHRDGQMVKKHNGELCSTATPTACNKCFPEFSPAQFMMRESFIKAHLEYVDMFISPSRFLANRFIEWGVPPEKMLVMENGRQITAPAPFRNLEQEKEHMDTSQNSLGEELWREGAYPAHRSVLNVHEDVRDGNSHQKLPQDRVRRSIRNVFGYFGQINPFKGALLTLQAARHLVKNGFTDFRLELFGNVEQQTEEFKTEFFAFLEQYKDYVRFHGKYKSEDIPQLMEKVDWVIVPSTWWENSPLVIQEAFLHRRPIICSNIGGMKEKVEDNVTGLHFQVRNEISLAETMQQAANKEGLWEQLVQNIGPRLSIEECARQHATLYDTICSVENSQQSKKG